MISNDIGTQLLVVSADREISRIVTKPGIDQASIRRLRCPYSGWRPCTLDCALMGATEEDGGTAMLWCRAGGGCVAIGMPDPENTDLDEMLALTGATAWEEQRTSENDRQKSH